METRLKELRSIKELLELMLNNQHKFHTGMCNWAFYVAISWEEYQLLKTYINENRPSMFSSVDAFIHCLDKMYWTIGNINPRIKWINKHIKLNK